MTNMPANMPRLYPTFPCSSPLTTL